jgi:hypothetical protein
MIGNLSKLQTSNFETKKLVAQQVHIWASGKGHT